MNDSLSFYIETYGCQMNVNDSELVCTLLAGAGHEQTTEIAAADIILANTCAVREGAENRVLAQIARYRQHKQARPGTIIGILGCMSTHLAGKLLKAQPELDLVMGPDQYRQLPHVIADLRAGSESHLLAELDSGELYEDLYPTRSQGVNAWVTIMRGCNNMCSYCIVPYTRGRERSRSVEAVVGEVRQAVEQGFREITLLGQNVNSYRDRQCQSAGAQGAGFAYLLHAVSEVEGLDRIRFTSPHPKDFTQDVLEEMASNPKVCHHMHLPLQAGSDDVLKRMRRGYSGARFLDLVRQARKLMPDLGLGTDLIVGFPGESEEDFQDTLRLVEEIRFDSAFTFAYSPREGAESARWEDDIPDEVKSRRLQQLIDLQRRITLEQAAACTGRSFEVLVESTSKKSDNEFTGRTSCNRVTVFPRDSRFSIGSLVRVRVDEVSAFTLRGCVTHVEGTPLDKLPQPV